MCDVRGLSPARDHEAEVASPVQSLPRGTSQRRVRAHAGYACLVPACPVLGGVLDPFPSASALARVRVPSSSPVRGQSAFPFPYLSAWPCPSEVAGPSRVRAGEEEWVGPWVGLSCDGPAPLDKHGRDVSQIRGRASCPNPSPDPGHVEDRLRSKAYPALAPCLVRERRTCRGRVPAQGDASGTGPVLEVVVDLVCVDVKGEVVHVCGLYHGEGVHEEAEASGLARWEAAYVRVEDRRSCDDLCLEGTAAPGRVLEVEVLGTSGRGGTFYACGAEGGRAHEERGPAYLVWEPKNDHVWKGWCDHEEVEDAVHVERGDLSLALCQREQGQYDLWLDDE